MEIKQYIKENESRFLEELFSLIRIPSISALPQHKDDMLACAERWRQLLLEAGADEAMIMPSQGNPLVYAEKRVSPDAPTVLIYAHYDVMPAEPLELWKSQPFEPEVRDGHIWARGADDDKGQAMIQAKAFEYVVKEGLLKHNVKFIFEGEEEIGSPSLNAFLKEHKELLKADVILVSDTSMLGADLPSLTTGLRGLAYWEIEVTGPNRDLHSGHFGGAVANPINTLCSMLAQVIDADGRITIPHFYDDVEEVPAAERDMIAHIPFDEKKYMEAIGVKALKGEKVILLWSVTVAVRRSMSAESGEDIREKVQKPFFHRRHTPKYLVVWFLIRTMKSSQNCLSITSTASLLNMFRLRLLLCTEAKAMYVRYLFQLIRLPKKDLPRHSVKNHWLYDAEEVFLLSAISNRFWESKLS